MKAYVFETGRKRFPRFFIGISAGTGPGAFVDAVFDGKRFVQTNHGRVGNAQLFARRSATDKMLSILKKQTDDFSKGQLNDFS